jgi:hypothetical protein
MSSLIYAPLRKPVHLTQISDEEIEWKMEDRKRAVKYFSALDPALYNKLYKRTTAREQTVLLPDAKGKIENILLTVPPYYDQKNPDVPIHPTEAVHFKSLLKHLSEEERHYTLLCHASQLRQIRRWFSSLGIDERSYSLAVSVFNYSIWAQDAYVALTDQNRSTILAESVCFTRDHDMSVADDLSMQTMIMQKQSYLYFQGGNVLQAGDYALVGMDYIVENEGRMFLETRKKVLKEFQRLFGRPVIALGREELIPHKHRQYLGGGLFQPVFHIDMYVTPTNTHGKSKKEIVFVGSPRLARKILGEKSEENDLDVYFDETATQLSEHFDVVRMPLLPMQYKTKEMQIPRHYYLSYNNALVETFAGRKGTVRNVYMPTFEKNVDVFLDDHFITQYYGDKKKYRLLDREAARIWEGAGFRVFKMDGLEDLAMSWGSVHCIVKAISRGSYEQGSDLL